MKSSITSRAARLLGLLVLLTLIVVPATTVAQDDAGTAGLVIQHGDGSTVYALVEIDDPTVDGLELIEQSGVDAALAAFAGMGAAVCSLNGEGCPSDDCFCQSAGDPALFWQYFVLDEGEWVSYEMGASSRTLGDGDVDGWAWAPHEHPLPGTTFDDIRAIVGDNTAVIVSEPGAEPEPLSASEDDSGIDRTMLLVAAGMAGLVLLIGVLVVMRNRKSTA